MNFTYRYLNLSRCSLSNFNVDILAELLSSCHSLEKLAIEWTHINSSMLNSISLQNGKTLEILALSYCFQTMGNEFQLEPIQQLVKNCNQLKELSLNCHDEIDSDGIDFLVNNLPPNLQKLSLETLDVTDNQVLTLVKRCPKLIAKELYRRGSPQNQMQRDGAIYTRISGGAVKHKIGYIFEGVQRGTKFNAKGLHS